MTVSDTSTRLSAAKLWLISQAPAFGVDAPRDLPYLAHALYALRIVETTAVVGLSADFHWRVYANPRWLMDTEIPELGRELAHLVWHLLMDHAGRARSMHVDLTTAEHWHGAAELTVHETLGPVGTSPEPTINEAVRTTTRRTGREGRDQSAEQYYAVLSGLPPTFLCNHPEQPADQGCRCGSCCDGLTRFSDLPADADTDTIGQVEADVIRKRVAIDYQEHAAKGRGTTPGEALRWARGMTNPTIPWEPLLARAVRRGIGCTTGRGEPTWTRPSRRQSVTPNILRPGWRRPVPHIAMIVDTSGTVDDQLLGRAMAEVDGAIAALGVPGASVTVIACDAAVGAVTRVRKGTDAPLIGGGGTDMRVGIAVATQQRPRPDLIVVLTDGYTPWPATPPLGSAVIGAILGRPGEALLPTPLWITRVDCVLNG